jgi:hypothetical protein
MANHDDTAKTRCYRAKMDRDDDTARDETIDRMFDDGTALQHLASTVRRFTSALAEIDGRRVMIRRNGQTVAVAMVWDDGLDQHYCVKTSQGIFWNECAQQALLEAGIR